MKFKAIIVIILLSLSVNSAWAAAGWTGYGTVEEIYPVASGVFYVRLNLPSNPSGCPTDWFYNDGTGVGANRVYGTLLSGMSTVKMLRVYVTGKCDQWGYSEISSVSVMK